MNTISPENCQYSTSGVVSPLSGTHKAPAMPVKIPETMKAIQRDRQIWVPTNSARTSVSRIAWSALPNGGFTVNHMTDTQAKTTTTPDRGYTQPMNPPLTPVST